MKAILPNTALAYDRIGTANSQDYVILFLHEALGSIGQWKDFPKQLCDALQLPGIVYERQGHGNSNPLKKERTAAYLHDYAWKELPAFLDAIQEHRKLILVGHSDGGTIALLYASQYPQRTASVVTMAAHVINEPETVAGIAPAITAFQKGKLDGLKKYHGAKTEQLFHAWANTWRSKAFENWDITAEITGCHQPGLFIQGASDQYGTRKQLNLIHSHYQGKAQSIWIEECGHHPHLEKSDSVIESIEQWWSSLG